MEISMRLYIRLLMAFGRPVPSAGHAEILEGVNKVVAVERSRKAGITARAVAKVDCGAVGRCSEHYNGHVSQAIALSNLAKYLRAGNLWNVDIQQQDIVRLWKQAEGLNCCEEIEQRPAVREADYTIGYTFLFEVSGGEQKMLVIALGDKQYLFSIHG